MALKYKQKEYVYTNDISMENVENKSLTILIQIDSKNATKINDAFANIATSNEALMLKKYKEQNDEIGKLLLGNKVDTIETHFGKSEYDLDNIIFMVLLDFLAHIGKERKQLADQVTEHLA